ncbi:uncharacterized protein SPAPADRAFT_71567 [Spathaspora passalidarum NRRL Y-27907]|uniref:TRP C-terminal domain-containing protein n=1 Tax=Spathaspora passalidarum (strain NRRL Y-27907 / 11-Y1) TaxID=619300 RepID=G3AP25_SPAPN|nr:uncharacterized protein SPAPADRAFT_71567 [Spathaspora passalidarum NRRL Y-27907]EGW32055.1 hypothetical protein SPAPADRAFT_71567 [Spathaspora passalidarum NRRL Y-27907]
MFNLPRLIAILILLLSFASTSQSCGISTDDFLLKPFIIDVSLDEDEKKLRFYFNTKVAPHRASLANYNLSDYLINDVDYRSNKYTTFHVEIAFMGKTFINENKRFCDMIAVKDTPSFKDSPRFPPPVPTTTPLTFGNYNNTMVSKRQDVEPSNNTVDDEPISEIFSNSTGQLVQCPLYYNDSIMIYYEADISDHFHRLGSYSARFSVVSNGEVSGIIGCSKTYITPVQPESVSKLIAYGVLVLIVVTAIVNLFTIAYSCYQESSNPLLFLASTICNADLLKQVDASIPGIVTYLQFALFIGGLDLQYPGFYQPLIAQIRWCALLGSNIIKSSSRQLQRPSNQDSIYVTIETGQLYTLSVFTTDSSIDHTWPNFIILLIIVIIIVIGFEQLFILLKLFMDNLNKDGQAFWMKKKKKNANGNKRKALAENFSLISRNNGYLMVGQVLHLFLSIFGMPFLVLTSFMFLKARELNGKQKYFPDLITLKDHAFSFTTSYDQIFLPSTYLLTNSDDDPINFGDHLRNSTFLNSTLLNSTLGTTQYTSIPVPSVVFGSILFTTWIALVLYFIINYLASINKNPGRLYTSLKTILLWAFYYNEYKPQRVAAVAYDIFSLVFKSLIIGLAQNHGIVQVVCLIIISVCDLMVLFVIRPHFVGLTLYSCKWMFPMARFLNSMLCIPFIRELEIGESVRCYVAYVQMLIHCIVAVIFVLQLLYWFVRTCISIYHNMKDENTDMNDAGGAIQGNYADEFNREFEYKPVVLTQSPIDRVAPIVHEIEDDDDDDDDDEENYYYRKKSEQILARMSTSTSTSNNTGDSSTPRANLASVDEEKEASTMTPVPELQVGSLRKHVDYKVREGDQIYQKYFMDAIDPEIKELWDSRRKEWDERAKIGVFDKIRKRIPFLKKKEEEEVMEKGFHVVRPKQLVVKTVEEVRQQQQQREEAERGKRAVLSDSQTDDNSSSNLSY